MTAGSETQTRPREAGRVIALPAPTAWPLVLAFGLTLLATGLVTALAVSLLGVLLSLFGAVGWFREVLPHEHHEPVPVGEEVITIATERHEVERIEIAPELERMRFPMEVYPIAAGVRGGLAGSVAMAAVAMSYGWISHGSIWYPVNLLGAVVYANALELSAAKLAEFSMMLLLVALILHLTTSVLVGLLYGTMLPMLPRHPILLGGVVAPVLWSGLVYSVLGLVHPLLNARIDWWWFGASQMAFGLVAGLVVVRHSRIPVRQFLPLVMRAGLEATGLTEERRDEEGKR